MKIIVLGPPGSGKGTQAVRLGKYCEVPHISTGDILRQLVAGKSSLARRVKSYMNSGKLVPDRIIVDIVSKRLTKKDARKGFVLDGFPRNLNQAGILGKLEAVKDKPRVFNLKVSDKTLVKRISGRRVCGSCSANYHVEYNPPKICEKCAKCGGSLYQRDDDKPQAIRNRLKVYKKESRPLVGYYAKKKMLVSISGEKSEKEVFNSLIENLKK